MTTTDELETARELYEERDTLMQTINKRNIHAREQKKEIIELKGMVTILERRRIR